MKRIIALLAVLATMLVSFSGCHKNEIPTGKPQEPVEKPEEKPDTKESISILAIGNSFSVDAMHYLYGFLKEAGYEKVYLGNLYIGSCSLKTHAGHFTANDKAYTYYVNESGSWVTKSDFSPIDALKSKEWDYISMQQASADSGMPDTYDPYMGQLIDIVTRNCPKAKLMWHMTWAYQSNSSHASFPKYDKDQLKMYESIVYAVKAKIAPVKSFVHIIPSGTAVQNLRTSFIGDNITRDGHHMSYNIGRYVTALMWVRQIAGIDVEKSSYRPADQTYTDHQIQAMKDAVEKAFKKPFEVTQSAYKESNGDDDVTGYVYPEYKANAALRKMVTDAGYDLTGYKELEYKFHAYSYYNSSKSSMLEAKSSGSTASNIDQFGSIGIYEKKDLPEGTIIACKGRAYRPEGWVSLDQKNSSRPAAVSTQIVVVDKAWWGSYNFRAFNISWEGNIHMSESQMNSIPEGFAIFVPTQTH